MGDRSAIEWTDATWNPVTGCSKVSPGCAHCYAETLSLRYGWSQLPWNPEYASENVVLHSNRLDQPLKWRRPRMVFVNSMSDLFHELVPGSYRREVWSVMDRARRHTFQVLTKRPELMRAWVRANTDVTDPVLPNVWLGTSIENNRWVRVLRSGCGGCGATLGAEYFPSRMSSSPFPYPLPAAARNATNPTSTRTLRP